MARPLRACRRWTVSSALKLGMPWAANILAAVDLPMPMPPVRPRTIMRRSCAGDDAVEFGIDGGGDAEPGGETGDGLVQEHAETFDGEEIMRAGRLEELGFQGGVDDVRDRQVGIGGGQGDFQRLVVDHAQRGGVHQQGVIAQGGAAVFPGQDVGRGECRG